jgi:hypothetical protein
MEELLKERTADEIASINIETMTVQDSDVLVEKLPKRMKTRLKINATIDPSYGTMYKRLSSLTEETVG